MRVMVTGTSGQLGGRLMSLREEVARRGWTLIPCGRDRWDMEAPHAIEQVLEDCSPDAVLNCGAYTAVDAAEDDAVRAHVINAEAPGQLAAACAKRDVHVVHISTDYVFDGQGKRPYLPSDPTAPLGAYGESKRAGEQAILSAHPTASIVRVSWLYDRDGKNFMNTMLRLAEDRSELTVVDDQWGCPTHAGHLANDLLHWLALMTSDSRATRGVHHYGHAGITTWHGFATAILGRRFPSVKVHPVPSAAFPTRATRPAYSKLDEAPFFAAIGHKTVTWESALEACLSAKFEAPN